MGFAFRCNVQLSRSSSNASGQLNENSTRLQTSGCTNGATSDAAYTRQTQKLFLIKASAQELGINSLNCIETVELMPQVDPMKHSTLHLPSPSAYVQALDIVKAPENLFKIRFDEKSLSI